MNQSFVSKACFNKRKKLISHAVQKYPSESMENALNSTQDDSFFFGYRRYPIRGNTSHCSFDIINTETNKVVALVW